MIEIEKRSDKVDQYQLLKKQVVALLEDEPNELANMANICSLIHMSFNHHWTGFYFVDGDELVLGPFQGPPACTRISKGKGVCGTAWKDAKVQVVENVHKFEGHIACSAESNSEIVLPIFNKDGSVKGVFDIDSVEFAQFDQIDAENLQEILSILN